MKNQLLGFCIALFFSSFSYAEKLPAQLQDVGIKERIGVSLPLAASLVDENGKKVLLGDYFKEGKPVVLNLVYFNCPMLCNLALSGVREGLSQVPLKMGDKFKVLSISIDPTDTPSHAKEFQGKYLVGLVGQPKAKENWHFLVTDQKTVESIASAVGFRYRYDPKAKEFYHAAGLFFLTPEGKLARVLYGIEYKPFNMKMAVLEASDRKFTSTIETMLLFCYHYDPNARGYSLVAVRLMQVAAGITVAVLAIFIIWLIKKYQHIGK